MDLKTIVRHFQIYRRKLGFLVFGIFLIWPIFHLVLINHTRMSSWRLFGWGMYATPTPETSRLRVVILDKKTKSTKVDAQRIHDVLTAHLKEKHESECINLFVERPAQTLQLISHNDLCHNDNVARDLDHFLHFGSLKHLQQFLDQAFSHTGQNKSDTIAFLTHQRFNLFQRKAYVESDVYHFSDDKVHYWGKIRDGG